MNVKDNKLSLPHRYRNKVVQILAAKGLTVTAHDVSNCIRGRVTDPEKTAAVMLAVKQVSKAHVKAQKLRSTMLGRH
jgi:hypothetical protein